jgi:hypothetical protein
VYHITLNFPQRNITRSWQKQEHDSGFFLMRLPCAMNDEDFSVRRKSETPEEAAMHGKKARRFISGLRP